MGWFTDWRARHARRRALRHRGYARYFGHVVHFPLGPLIYERVVAHGTYEPEIVDVILGLVRPGTAYIDVGANIGMLSLPVLARIPNVQVLSIEASPDILPYLERTHHEAARGNWTLFKVAVGDRPGEAEFYSGDAASSPYAGLRETSRGGSKRLCRVPMRTLDDIWREVGSPTVSAVKLDIEGAETLALQGARDLIANIGPALILEWSLFNLPTYGLFPEVIFNLCEQIGYDIYAVPDMVRVDSEPILHVKMRVTETLLLLPKARRCNA